MPISLNEALMFWILRILPLSLLLACAEGEPYKGNYESRTDAVFVHPVRLEVYLFEADPERDCARVKNLSSHELRSENFQAFNSISEFETNGFASIHTDHIASSKKMLLLIFATDPTANEVIGKACIDNIEVEKNTIRDVHLVLSPLSFGGLE